MIFASVQADALCVHNGKLYAKTTSSQEFAESHWVVRARVVSARDQWPDGWSIYRLRLIRSYKGDLPRDFTYFTWRNSGSFALDRGAAHDIGGEYLLFLNPYDFQRGDPRVARRATSVNYSCGQSRPWPKVSSNERTHLLWLSLKSSSAHRA